MLIILLAHIGLDVWCRMVGFQNGRGSVEVGQAENEPEESVVVVESARFAGVVRVVVAAVWASHGEEEYGWAVVGEPVVVAVGAVVAGADFEGGVGFVVEGFELVEEGFGVLAFGVEDHEAFVATTEHVDVAEELDFVEVDGWIIGCVAGAQKA